MKFYKGDQVRRLSFNTMGMDVGSLWTVDNPCVAFHPNMMSVENWNGVVFRDQFELVKRASPEKKLPAYVEHVPARAAYNTLKSTGTLTDQVKYSRCHGNKVYLSHSNPQNSLTLSKSEVIALADALRELAEYMED